MVYVMVEVRGGLIQRVTISHTGVNVYIKDYDTSGELFEEQTFIDPELENKIKREEI